MTDVIETEAVEADRVEDESPQPEPNLSLPAIPGTDPVGRVPVGVAPLSVVPAAEEIKALASLAVVMAKSEVGVSKSLRGKPNDVLAVFLTARGLGVDIMTALRTFHVIEGQVSLSPKIRLAMAQEIGRERHWRIWPCEGTAAKPCVCGAVESNGRTKAVWHAQRPESPGLVFSSEYTWEDAQEAEMVSWDCKPGAHTADCRKVWPWANNRPTRPEGLCKENYRKYPARMLSWRAVGYLLDDRFPEVGQGLYSPDELGAITDEDGNPVIDVASVEVPPGMVGSDGRVAGAPPVPEAPGVAKASDELKDAIRARIAALPVGGRAALKEWWALPKGDGAARAPLAVMTQADSIAVQAMVAQIERRAEAGEWAETAPEAPVTAEPVPEAVTVPEPVDPSREEAGRAAAAVKVAEAERRTLVDEVAAEVEQMDNAMVAEYLEMMGVEVKAGAAWKAKRALLQVAIERERIESSRPSTLNEAEVPQ